MNNLLAAAGESLYGKEWVEPLGRDLKVDGRTMRHWRSGRRVLGADHAVLRNLLELLRTRAEAANRVADSIEKVISEPSHKPKA
jgi:hypothetical protein